MRYFQPVVATVLLSLAVGAIDLTTTQRVSAQEIAPSTDRATKHASRHEFAQEPVADDVPGELLPASAIGDSYIEDLATASRRARNLPDRGYVKQHAPFHRAGQWVVPTRNGTFAPHSGDYYIINKYGDTEMSFAFDVPTTLESVWVIGQGGTGVWAEAIRAIGYRGGVEVARTDWSAPLGAEPARFDINLANVDRVVIEALPSETGGSWYGLDDLTYSRMGRTTTLDFEDLGSRDVLTGTNYGGVIWEVGGGKLVFQGDAVHAPQEPPGFSDDEDDAGQGGAAPPPPPGGLGTAPELVKEFEGIAMGDEGVSSFPPDTCGAVGPNHYVIAVNNTISFHNKSDGTLIDAMWMGAFHPGSGGDPRVIYDHFADRWIVITTDFNTRIYFAYSLTDDPTGSWFKTNFIASQGADANRWPDYPTLGFNDEGIYISAFMVNAGMTVWAIDKAPLLDATPSLDPPLAFRNLPYEQAIQPVVPYTNISNHFFVSRASSTLLRVRQLVGNFPNQNLTTLGFVNVPSHSSPPDAPALNTGVNMDTGDTRLMNAVYRNGFIYTAHTISLSGRAAIRWYRINAGSLVDTNGIIFDSLMYYYYPSIAANENDDVVIGFSGSNSSQYVAAYYVGRQSDDPTGQTSPPELYQPGTGSQTHIDNQGRNRWGDYSLTTVDLLDDTFYTIQAYGGSGNLWRTRVAHLAFDYVAPPPNDDCANATLLPIAEATTAFTTLGATTDGPDQPGSDCDNGFSQIDNDAWFRLFSPCEGQVRISLCGSDFDARMAVYGSSCPGGPEELIACSDDFCGQSPEVVIDAENFQAFYIRVGGENGATGEGDIVIECVDIATPCPEDLSDDGIIDTIDLLDLLGAWGACADCPQDLNGDDLVDTIDLLALLNAWGPCPE